MDVAEIIHQVLANRSQYLGWDEETAEPIYGIEDRELADTALEAATKIKNEAIRL